MCIFIIFHLNSHYDYFVCFQIFVSKKWGFTKWEHEEYEEMRSTGRLIPDGVGVQYKREHGPLADWKHVQKLIRGLN